MEIPKYSPDELNVVDRYPSPFPGRPGPAKYNFPISSRENLELLFTSHHSPWMPFSSETVMFTPRALPDNVARGFVVDPDALAPGEAGGFDIFGIEWEYVPEVGGSMVRPGAPKVGDLEHWEDYISFPDFSTIDWAASAEKAKPLIGGDRPVSIWILNGLFERLISFMDFEGAAMALIDEDLQESVHRLFDKLCIMYDELIGIYKQYYDPYIIYFHDDWGSQRSPFFSLDTCREMVVPYLKRICESVHKRGMRLELHCCGQVEMLVPAMIEAGVDTWSGQPMNDRKKLTALYGDKFVFGVLLPQIPENAGDEDILRLAQKFYDDYGQYPVIAQGMGMADSRFRNEVYRLSRLSYEAQA